jgi:hypothetical protein
MEEPAEPEDPESRMRRIERWRRKVFNLTGLWYASPYQLHMIVQSLKERYPQEAF